MMVLSGSIEMLWPFFGKKRAEETSNAVLVLIGVHREELAFGDQVVKPLPTGRFGILRIKQGLSARRPRPDQFLSYLDNHDRLYQQITSSIGSDCKLIIDLHCRLKERADADLFSGSEQILKQAAATLAANPDFSGKAIRPIRMISDKDLESLDLEAESPQLFAKPELPESLWRADSPLYLGLEIYVDEEGAGTAREWAFARQLIIHLSDQFQTRQDENFTLPV